MPTAQRAASTAATNFTVVSDGYHYEIVECANGSKGIADLNDRYPVSMGWMIVGHAEAREGAERIVAEQQNSPRMDYE